MTRLRSQLAQTEQDRQMAVAKASEARQQMAALRAEVASIAGDGKAVDTARRTTEVRLKKLKVQVAELVQRNEALIKEIKYAKKAQRAYETNQLQSKPQ